MKSPIKKEQKKQFLKTIDYKLKTNPQVSSLKSQVYKSAFTLVELIIVVSILGILAAIVLPEVQGHTQRAKEAAAKDNLRILRNVIQRYAVDHNGIAPGYTNDNPSSSPTGLEATIALEDGYISEIPENPFNGSKEITALANNASFPAADGTTGWIYKPFTKEIRLNYAGNDSEGKAYYSY